MKNELVSEEGNIKGNILLITLFSCAIYLTIIQQFPIIKENFYSEIRYILYIVFSFFALMSLAYFNQVLKINFYRYFFITLVISTIIYSVLSLSNFEGNNNILELFIPFGILSASIILPYSDKKFNDLINIYIILALLMGISNVWFYVGGIEITQVYEIPYKNQIGPIIGSAIIIVWIKLLNNYNMKYYILYLFIFIALVGSLLIIRNRASLVAIGIILIIYTFLKVYKKLTIKFLLFIITTIALALILTISGFLNPFYQFLWNSVTLNYDINNLNSLSAGRTDVYTQSIVYIINYPFFGESMNTTEMRHTPHNYILNKLVNYGFLGAFPVILFYLYLIGITIKAILLKGAKAHLCYWLLLYSLIVSQFEYTYPFGPGVSQVLLWFIIGQYLRKKYNILLQKEMGYL